MPLRRRGSAVVALLMSLLVPGLGAAYNGQPSKALVHFSIFASLFQMTLMIGGATSFVLGLGFIGTWLFAAVDAYRTAQLIHAGLAPNTEADAIARRLYGHPFAWAIVLITLGTLFLLHTLLGVRLPIRELLPMVLVGLGAYMLFDYVRRRDVKKAHGQICNSGFPSPSLVNDESSDTARVRRDGLAT